MDDEDDELLDEDDELEAIPTTIVTARALRPL